MRLSDTLTESTIDPLIDRLLFFLALIVLLFLYPYFIWGNFETVHRISHLVGNVILLFIIIRHHKYDVFNTEIALFFILVYIYSMVAGTEIHKYTYIHLLTLLFILLRPDEQFRIFGFIVTILSIVYIVGLISYLLSVLGLNIPLGKAISPVIYKSPYIVYFGHAEESNLPVYRFSSIFDEAGLVGTLNGLLLAATGISMKDRRSIILLVTGLITFSLAFYIILILILLFNLNIKKAILYVFILIALYPLAGNKIRYLIAERLSFKDGHLVGDNRTHHEFDSYYNLWLSSGGTDVIRGKGVGYSHFILKESWQVSSYKLIVIDYGILGTSLIVIFYAACVYFIENSKKGWFLLFIFMISAYQRPDIFNFFNIVMFIGGLTYLKLNTPDE